MSHAQNSTLIGDCITRIHDAAPKRRLGIAIKFLEQCQRDDCRGAELGTLAQYVMREFRDTLDDPLADMPEGYMLPGDEEDPQVRHARLVRGLKAKLSAPNDLGEYLVIKLGVQYIGEHKRGELDLFGIRLRDDVLHYHYFEVKTGRHGVRREAEDQHFKWQRFMHEDLGVSYWRLQGYLVKRHKDGTPRICAPHYGHASIRHG